MGDNSDSGTLCPYCGISHPNNPNSCPDKGQVPIEELEQLAGDLEDHQQDQYERRWGSAGKGAVYGQCAQELRDLIAEYGDTDG